MKEIWKDIEEYEGLYQISNLGRVKRILFINNIISKPENRILSNKLDNLGYVQVTLCKNGTRKYKRIHRLAAKAFLPNPNNLPCVNHKDGDKNNNRIDNLEWCTHSYNTKHALSNGLIDANKIKKARQKNIKKAQEISHLQNVGETNCKSVLREKEVLEIRKIYSERKMTQKQLAQQYGVHKDTISRIIHRETWKHI